jgi:hypothetical protein
VEAATQRDRGSVPASNGHRSRALGVDLLLPGPTLGLPIVSGPSAGRRATVEIVSGTDGDRITAAAETRRLVEWKPNGLDRKLTLDVNPTHGYRIWAACFGTFFISPDGSTVLCAPETEDHNLWQRYLIGQVLPFVAVLQGIEVAHGSAVVLGGRAVAFAGGSGAGKSSLATRLQLRGATLVTDDVLALERDGSRVAVHPGPGIIGVRHDEFAKLTPEEISKLGRKLAENEKEVVFGVRREERTLPLASVYFMDRDPTAEALAFEPTDSASNLLASNFNTVVRGRDRLERMLDVFALLSKSAQVFSVTVPASVDASALAAAIEGHATGLQR